MRESISTIVTFSMMFSEPASTQTSLSHLLA